MFKILSNSAKYASKSIRQFQNPAKRAFSGPSMRPPTGTSYMNYALLGAGTAGLAYLMMKGGSMRRAAPVGGTHMNYFHPVVQDRIRGALMYFGGSLAATGALVSALRNSRYAYANPWVMLFGSIGLMFGTLFTDY